MVTRKHKFQSSENLCKHKHNFIIGFISLVLLSVSYENIRFRRLVLLENSKFFFEKISKQWNRRLQYNVNNLGT